MIEFEVNQRVGRKIPVAVWRQWMNKIGRILKISKAEVSIALVGTAEIRRLNRLYRKIDKVTDVLSFGEPETGDKAVPKPGNYLGEIIICLPRAQKQAKAAGHSLKSELELLLVHGFLHLLGYDHEKNKDAQIMRGIEQKIIRK